jgi:hypothetical protein
VPMFHYAVYDRGFLNAHPLPEFYPFDGPGWGVEEEMCGMTAPGTVYGHLNEIGKDAPVPLFIGHRKRVAGGRFRFKLYRDFSNDPAMQCSLDGFLAHWPLFWQRPRSLTDSPTSPPPTNFSSQPPDSRRAEWLVCRRVRSRAGEHFGRF